MMFVHPRFMVGLTPIVTIDLTSVQLVGHSEPHAPKASRARQWTPEPPLFGGDFWLVVEPTPLKNISQNGNLLQVGVKIKNI